MTTMDFTERTVGELAVEAPASIRVFEAWKIDYCCGGRTPLADACAAVGRRVEDFVAELERTAAVPEAVDWTDQTLQAISANVVATYHAYTREELVTLMPIAEKVFGVHGQRHPELAEVVSLIRDLAVDMMPHMLKEEQVLFPYVSQLEAAALGDGIAPTPFFGTVRNPVRMMMLEHDRVGELLAQLRVTASEFAAPHDACFSYRELYRRLAELEARTHEHIHIENNLYFPRAVELEDRTGNPLTTGQGCGMHACDH